MNALGCDHAPRPVPFQVPTEGLPVRCRYCGHRGTAWPLSFGYAVEWELEYVPGEPGTRIG